MLTEHDGEKALLEQIKFGRAIKGLVQNPDFVKLMDRLKARRDESAEKLLTVDPTSANLDKIKKLQNDVWRHDELAAEIYSIIEAGMLAEEEYQGNLEKLE